MASLIPQSLFARLVGALILVISVTLLVIVVLIVRERRELSLLRSDALNAVSAIAETSAELAALDPEARREALEKYRTQSPALEEARRRAAPERRREIDAIQKAFAERIRQQLGAGYSVSIQLARGRSREIIPLTNSERFESTALLPPPSGAPRPRPFDVTVTLPDGDRLVYRMPAPQPGPPLPHRIFLELAILTAVLVLALYVMTRTITKPLSDLARAADAAGRGESLAPLKERGARELRDATRAFNAMQDRLHRYLDSRTRVLAAMSHDLRTPLTRLRLRAEALDDPDTRQRFVADLEEMSQMVSGALSMFKGLTDSEASSPLLIDDLLASMQAEYAELGENITIEGRSNGPILAKPNALKRCLSNLLHNAVKYGERAHVRITDGRELEISIRDAGPGIPEEALEHVFEPFYRLESSRGRDTGGTGLGLSIARDIAQAHGGSIVLKNLPQRGLEAVLTLPRGSRE